MMKSKVVLFALLVCIGLLTSCVTEDLPVEQDPNAEVSLSLTFNAGTRALGDPGTDHNEWNAEWDNLGIYFVYTSGQVESFILDKTSFSSPETFAVYEGDAQVFAVAFPKEQTPQVCRTASEVYNMRTLSLDDPSVASQKQNYMRNIFCGYSSPITITQGENKLVEIKCNRLAAKVDVQYDMQSGIESGTLVNPLMSDISFLGYNDSYVFPQMADNNITSTVGVIDTRSAQLSERNGRVYSYVFPGKDLGVSFTMTLQPGNTEKEYKAIFANPLISDSWYKINFNVTGSTATSLDKEIILTLDNPNEN